MPGFGAGLAGIGAGLGQFAEYYQKQKQQEQQTQLLQLTLQKFAQEQQDRQRQQQAATSLFGAISGGALGGDSFGGAPPMPQTSPLAGMAAGASPATPPSPAPRPPLPPGVGGGARSAGDAWLNQNAPFPTLARPNPPAPQFTNDVPGPDVVAQTSGPGAPSGNASPAGAPQGPGTNDASGGGLPGIPQDDPIRQQGQQVIKTTAQSLPTGMYGRMSLSALAQQIDKANPGADPMVKMMALEMGQKLLAPTELRQWEEYKLMNEQEFRRELQDRSDTRQDKSLAASDEKQIRMIGAMGQRGETAGWGDPLKTDSGWVQTNKRTGEVRPVDLPDKVSKIGAGGEKSSQNVEVTDAEGKVIFSGSAKQTPQGWVSDKDQQPVPVPDDGNIRITGRGGQGRQAAAQIQSMIGSSSELVGEARNLMELPSTAVAGIFQGVQSVPANQLGEAMKRSLANKLTPEESTDLATSFQGVARSLATIEAQGRATGLVGLTGMSQGLMPQTGDTTGNVLRKMATLRQIMERNIDAIEASPNASAEQKKLLKNLRAEMATVIPFTVSEVNKLQHGDAETVMQAAKKFGLAGGQVPLSRKTRHARRRDNRVGSPGTELEFAL